MSVFGMDEQLRIEQQKTDTGVVSSVNGWMNNGLPTEEQKPVKYNKDGKLVLDEQEIVCEDGRMVLEKCLQDEVMEVEDLGPLLPKPTKVQKKKEEPAIKKEEEVKPRGGGMKIIIKGPFKVKHAAPSFIKEKKKVQEAPPVVEEAEDSGVETTPTHQPKKHKVTLLSYEQEETLKWAMGSVRMPPYDIASWQPTDPQLHRATESVTRSEKAPQVSRAEEKVVNTPVEEVQGVATNTAYSKPSYDTVRQDRYKALTHLVPSMQAAKLDTAEEKEVKTSLGEVQGLVPNIVYSTACSHTVRQDRYKAFSHLVPSAEAPSIKLNEGKEQKAHLRLVMKGGDLAPINWHKAAVAAITQEYVKAKYSQVPSNQPIHIAKIQSAMSDLESIETHVDIEWNTAKPMSVNHQYSKAKFTFIKSDSPVYFADTQTAETKLENVKVLADLDWVKPELLPVASHYYKTKLQFTKSKDPLYSGIQESIITVPQSVDDLAPIQKEKANVVDVSHKYDKAKSSQVSSYLSLHKAESQSTVAVAESVDGKVKELQYNKPEYEKVQQLVWNHNTNVVTSTTAQYPQGNQKNLHLAEDEVEGIIEPFRARGCKFEMIPQPYNEAVKYEITPSQQPTYQQAKSHDLVLTTEAVKENTDQVEFQKPTVELTGQDLFHHDTAVTKSGEPTYLQGKKNHLILTTEVAKENTDQVEFQKPTVELTGQTLFQHDTAITKSGEPTYHQAKKEDLILTTEVAKENTDQVEFQKPTVELTGQELFHHDTAITESGQPTYLQAKKNHLILTTEVTKEITDRVQFDKAAVELTGQKLFRHNTAVTKSKWRYFGVREGEVKLKTEGVHGLDTSVKSHKAAVEQTEQDLFRHDTDITKSGEPTYHQAKKQNLYLTTEVAKENTDQVDFHKPTVDLIGQKLFQHDTAITKSGEPTYLQAKKQDLILTTEVAKENTEKVEFQKPTVELTGQDLFHHDTAITESGQPTYHQGKKNHLILTTEVTKEITDRVQFDKAAVELTGQKLFRHNTAVTKSKWRYFGVREGRFTLQTEGVLGLDADVKYETATVRKVEQELHTANKEEVLVETADYFHTKLHRAEVPTLETLEVVEPLAYQTAVVHKVEQVYVKANQEEVSAEAPSYHEAEVKEVTAPQLEQGETELEDLPYKTANVQKVETVYAKADQGEVTIEAPMYNTAIKNSAFLTLSETKDMPEIKYDTCSPQAVTEEPLHNVIVGESKIEWHWVHAEEGELDELKLEKTRKLKPPIIETAVRGIVDQVEMTRPVFITNQGAVHAPLPTHMAKELNSLPEWETCQTFTVEEVTPLRAKASVALMNVCRAQASQPKVQLAEEVPIVKVDAVDRAMSPPPKTRPGLFYVKPKEVPQPPLEEVGSIDDLNTESAKVNEEETPTLHKVTVTPVTKLKLELPKLEIREETETITVDDLDLSPVTVLSPKPREIHAKIQLEEPTDVPSQMHLSLQALPRPLLKQANEDSLEEVPLGSTLEIPELAFHKARTSMCPLLTSHRAGAIKPPIQRAPPGYNQDWRTLKRLEGQRASLMVNGETEAPYISRASSVQSLSSQLSNDLAWTYADDKKPTKKAETKEPSPAASPEKLPSPPRTGSRKPLDDNTFKAPEEEETDAPTPPKDEPKAAPAKRGTAIQMVRELLGLPTKGKTQPETKPAAPVTKETPPEPVVKEMPNPEPVVKETPAPVESKAPEPVVKETPAPEPVVKETPAPEPVVKEKPAPEPVVKETPAPEPVVKEKPAPEPVVKETPVPEPVVKETPAPVENKAPEPIAIKSPPPEQPEPDYDVPTTPIPSSLVVPSGPQKPPPAASSPPEAASATPPPLGEVSLTFLVPTSSGIKIIKTS